MELEVQKYLRSGKTLENLKAELEIKSNVSGDLVILNYSQTDSPKAHPIVMECRGLVLEMGTWNLVMQSFSRFFNYGENLEITKEFDFSKAIALSKIDGCCHESTKIITENGEKTIKELCENRFNGLILGYNVEEQKVKWAKVQGHSIQEEDGEWYEIELEDGTKITLTGNHYVWIPELNCYRKVKDLTGKEGFLLEKVV